MGPFFPAPTFHFNHSLFFELSFKWYRFITKDIEWWVKVHFHYWTLCVLKYTSIFHWLCMWSFAFSIYIWHLCISSYLFAGTSTPPGISAAAVPSIAAPIGVNGFSALPPQSNGQPTSEPIYTNGIHPYPGEPIRTSKWWREWSIHFIITFLLILDG